MSQEREDYADPEPPARPSSVWELAYLPAVFLVLGLMAWGTLYAMAIIFLNPFGPPR
jgi:hypothetical protein